MGQVAMLDDVRPKTMNRRYRNQSYVIVYLPKEKKWSWEVTIVHKMVFKGEPKATTNQAQKAAEKFIDESLEKMK